jgi:hypothetical protein
MPDLFRSLNCGALRLTCTRHDKIRLVDGFCETDCRIRGSDGGVYGERDAV